MEGDIPNDNRKFHVELKHDIVQSMQQQIIDLTKSLSIISIQNQQLSEKINQQKIKRCPEGHPMRYIYTKNYLTSTFHRCDKCRKRVNEKSNVCWSCVVCDYDLCYKCGDYKKKTCVFGHPLQFVGMFMSSKFCDICKQKSLKSGWHCDCDFDICEKCHDAE